MDGLKVDCSFLSWIPSPSSSSFRSGFFWLVLHCTKRSPTHPRRLRWNAPVLCPNKRWWRTRSVSGSGWCDSRDEVVTYTHTEPQSRQNFGLQMVLVSKYMNVIWNKMAKVMKYHEVCNHIQFGSFCLLVPDRRRMGFERACCWGSLCLSRFIYCWSLLSKAELFIVCWSCQWVDEIWLRRVSNLKLIALPRIFGFVKRTDFINRMTG